MTENTFYQDYDVPQDLRFSTDDILRAGGLNCAAKLSPQYFEDIFTPPSKITEVRVDLQFLLTGKEILARGTIFGKRDIQCARCLRETTQDFSEEFMESYSMKDEIIDIMLLVRQTLALTEDIQFLCKDTCKGLCSLCGQDLNKKQCGCTPESTSPFAALKGKFK